MMAYRSSTYRPGTEDEPNLVVGRLNRERSPRRNGTWSPGRESSAVQGPGRLGPRQNRSRSPDRSTTVSGSLRRMSDSERRNHEREERSKKASEWKIEHSRKSSERRQSVGPLNENGDLEGDTALGSNPQIGGYSDEFIREVWKNGARVTTGNSSRFAADVLLYVRKRFYDEVGRNESKRTPQNGNRATKLLLEDMKWISDTKISPLTDSKDLYLCNDCENNHTFYSLESLLYHYATRHTGTLSNGTVVVDWKAEWPEHPPFNPEPEITLEKFKSPTPVTTAPNDPPVAPRGFVPRSVLEKKQREQELMIREAKEELQRKEREKRNKDYDYRERQFRICEVDDKMKMEVEKQGGIALADVQQNGRSEQDDITYTPQPSHASALDNSAQNIEQAIVDSNMVLTPHNPLTRSVRIGSIDSSTSTSRAVQRLHLTNLFTQFMSEVSQQTALQLRRDSAKKILDQKITAYNKAQIMLKEFPSAEESTRASKERAQKEFEQVDQELSKKREVSIKLSEEISELVYPEEEPCNSERDIISKIKDLDERLVQFQGESEVVKQKQKDTDELCNSFMTQKDRQIIIETIGNEFGSVRKDISGFAAKTSILEAEMAQLKQSQAVSELRSSFEELSTRINDLQSHSSSADTSELKSMMVTFSSRLDEMQHARSLISEVEPRKSDEDITALRNTVHSLSSRMSGLEEFRVELSEALETIKSNLALQTAAVNDRSEILSVHSAITTLSKTESELRLGLAKLQSQMHALGKDVRAIKMIDRGHRPSDARAHDTCVISNEVRIAIHDEIRAQQEAVDAVLDEKFGSIDGQAGDLKAQIKTLELQVAEVNVSLKALPAPLAAQLNRFLTDLGGVRGDINSAREEINSLRKGEIQSLQVACNTLDYRMNNLSTEYLARQILGHLEAHNRGGDRNIASIELRLKELEKRAASSDGSSLSKKDIDESLEKIRKELFVVVDERLVKVKNMFIELNAELVNEQMQLRTEISTNRSDWESIKVDVAASKSNISEAMGFLKTEVENLSSKLQSTEDDLSASKIEFTEATKSLRAEVDSIGPTLQNVQDDLGATKSGCMESSAALKAEIAKASKISPAEKRKIDSPEPFKTNGHRKRRAKQRVSDSEDGS